MNSLDVTKTFNFLVVLLAVICVLDLAISIALKLYC